MSNSDSNIIENVLSEFGQSKNAHELAIFCCNELIDSFKNYEQIQNNPSIYIEEYFNELHNQIEKDRIEKIKSVNRVFEEVFCQLEELKNEFNLSKPSLADDLDNNEMNLLKATLNEWIVELSDINLDKNRCETIQDEGKRLEYELNLKLMELKSKCLLKKSIEYETKDIELDFKGNLVMHKSVGAKRSSMYQVIKDVQRMNSFKGNREQFEKKVRFAVETENSKVNGDPCRNTNSSSESSNKPCHYIALVDYKGAKNGELSFKKGEILHVDKNDKFSDDEWFGSLCLCNLSDQQKTFRKSGKLSPHNIATFTDLEKEPWFFGALSRTDAENYLKPEPNHTGSYLIRFSLSNSEQAESNKFHFYTLSVRDSNHDIKHYKIYLSKDDKNHTFYSISPKVKLFKDIKELIHHFKNKLDGLCAILTEPCSIRV